MNTLDLLTYDVQRLTAELNETSADVALLTRLKDAVTLAARLSIELGDAQDKLAAAMTAKVLADRRARFARFRDIIITVAHGSNSNGSALAAAYNITYEALTYDHEARDSVFMDHSVEGFAALPGEVYEYLMSEKPHVLPPIILALAPGDPEKAMDVYHIGMKRGYLTQ
ncbi:hypothetical protein KX816_09395 [Sphingosinicellaceae bacterium]|nr:hypothetical protein KX816_09395 [Sphingosinicellaceae bacterium]